MQEGSLGVAPRPSLCSPFAEFGPMATWQEAEAPAWRASVPQGALGAMEREAAKRQPSVARETGHHSCQGPFPGSGPLPQGSASQTRALAVKPESYHVPGLPVTPVQGGRLCPLPGSPHSLSRERPLSEGLLGQGIGAGHSNNRLSYCALPCAVLLGLDPVLWPVPLPGPPPTIPEATAAPGFLQDGGTSRPIWSVELPRGLMESSHMESKVTQLGPRVTKVSMLRPHVNKKTSPVLPLPRW